MVTHVKKGRFIGPTHNFELFLLEMCENKICTILNSRNNKLTKNYIGHNRGNETGS